MVSIYIVPSLESLHNTDVDPKINSNESGWSTVKVTVSKQLAC